MARSDEAPDEVLHEAPDEVPDTDMEDAADAAEATDATDAADAADAAEAAPSERASVVSSALPRRGPLEPPFATRRATMSRHFAELAAKADLSEYDRQLILKGLKRASELDREPPEGGPWEMVARLFVRAYAQSRVSSPVEGLEEAPSVHAPDDGDMADAFANEGDYDDAEAEDTGFDDEDELGGPPALFFAPVPDVPPPDGFYDEWAAVKGERHLGASVLAHYAKLHDSEEYERVCRFYCIPTASVQEHHVKHYILSMLGDDVVCYSKLRDGVSAHWRRDETTGMFRWTLDEKRASIDSHIDENIVVPLLGYVKAMADEFEARTEQHIEAEGITNKKQLAEMRGKAQAKQRDAERLASRWGTMSMRVRLSVHKEIAAAGAHESPFDQNRMLFAFTNTVFDVEARVEVHIRKYDMVLMSSPREWTPPSAEAKRKVHDLFVSILPPGPRQTFVSMLRRGLTADRVEKIFMLTGKGRNGKGMIMSFYEHLLGAAGTTDYAYTGNLASIISSHNSGPNQEKASMHRKRFIRFSEPGTSITAPPIQFSILKNLTGDDKINARGLHSTDTSTELWFTLALDMNRPPKMEGDMSDDAAVERLVFIQFPYTFTADAEKLATQPNKYRPIDTTLKRQMESYRCALFDYLFHSSLGVTTFDEEEGMPMPAPSMDIFEDAESKAFTKRYLQDADPLDNYLMSNYERIGSDDTLQISIKKFTEDFLKSDEMKGKGNDERGKYTATTVFEMLIHNHNVVDDEDLIRPHNGVRKTIGKKRIQSKTLVHWKKRSFDDDDDDDDDAMQDVTGGTQGGDSSSSSNNTNNALE